MLGVFLTLLLNGRKQVSLDLDQLAAAIIKLGCRRNLKQQMRW